MTSDHRMTWGLIIDVLDVLERHGYRRHDNQHTGQAAGLIFTLTRIYEGGHEASDLTYLDQAYPSLDPRPPAPGADQDAIILTHAEVGTIFAALDIAADYQRDRAEMCIDCADQSCPTCQGRLRDAQAYRQLAAQLLQTAQASRPRQPEPDREAEP